MFELLVECSDFMKSYGLAFWLAAVYVSRIMTSDVLSTTNDIKHYILDMY